jgi:hypothetical protein
MTKWAPIVVALLVFAALMPVVCSGGEGDPLVRCATFAGWTLPGFSYPAGGVDDITLYAFPLLVAVASFFAVRWLLSRKA